MAKVRMADSWGLVDFLENSQIIASPTPVARMPRLTKIGNAAIRKIAGSINSITKIMKLALRRCKLIDLTYCQVAKQLFCRN